ncbi:O-antigen ligase family protein [Anaerospora hongkongensis]|uniref:O-antigen ligase family protein n=1 Tax=Anaerospora hongkongensis TaxID=244830 RepID=UPI00289C3FFE|nr:O-antigen ligase family protein [Anaerospora hongkongensis]
MNSRIGFQLSSVFLLSFITCLLVSTVYSINIKVSKSLFFNYLIGVIVFYAAYYSSQNAKLRKYNKYFLYFSFVYALVAALLLIYQHFILNINRPSSFFGGVNTIVRYFELVIPVLLSILFFKPLAYKRNLAIGMVLLCLFCALFLTYSRGAWIAVGVGTFIILLVNRVYKGLFGGSILLAVVFLQDNYGLKRLESILQLTHQDNLERVNGWISSLDIIRDHFWTGIGLGNFKPVYLQYMLPQAREHLVHAHNIFLVFGTEGGGLTAIFFILFSLVAFGSIFHGVNAMTHSNYRTLVIGLSLAAASSLIHGMVDHAFRKPLLWIIFMFELGLCFGLIKHYARKSLNS